ncbi:nucleotidyl transferase [Hymenobacter sp. BT175]|uniref:sugar phosphate nucleotidyltransferase n=1 Tax=Hymenobacter translucens TaxID=2886507 RepID=UPI001D0E5E3C|nr:sugar phosphate nucleotidyltransferase [Hymenobacter translucens]MCC2548027.1 nucleotidyl transferase [Hymenobacter translucens]
MKIRKAVITAAARGARLYPVADTIQKAMLPVVDVDGLPKPVLQIVAEEAFESGVEELAVIVAPGDGDRYRAAFGSLRDNLVHTYQGIDWARQQAGKIDHLLRHTRFVEQPEPRGYGHAVFCAREFVGDEPFLLMHGDYLYVPAVRGQRCAAQLLALAGAEGCAVSAVNATPEHQVGRYGTLTGQHRPGRTGVYQVEKIIEKPALSTAELELQTPGLRMGYYLCFFGMHVLTPALFPILDRHLAAGADSLLLTPALQELAATGPYLALEVQGSRYDLSAPQGLLRAQLALGLAGEAQAETLSAVVELLAEANGRPRL